MGRYGANLALKAARLALRLSQDGFAERLGSHMREHLELNVAPSGNLVGMWERGETRPGLAYRQGLTSFTGMSEFDLGLATAPATAHAPKEDDTNRRELLMGSAVTAGAALIGLPITASLGPADLQRPTPQLVAELHRLADLHRDWLYEHGASTQVQRGIAQLLNRSSALLAHASSEAMRRDVLGAISDISGVAAYTCRDLGLHTEADQHYVTGVQAAQAAGAHDLAGHLVVRMAGHQVERRQPEQILAHLETASRIGTFTPRQVSNQRAIAAWAHAIRGDDASVRRLVGDAETAFVAPSRAQGTATWQSRHVHESELFSLTGAALATLAEVKPQHAPEAISRLTRALSLLGGGFSRNAILDHLSLAEAYLAAHQLQPALDAAHQAREMSHNVSSRLVSNRLLIVSGKLRAHSRAGDVADFIHLIEGNR
ncbi:hypothetical protein GCM10010411_75040 [Actinomadura fulvescens]|uniref:Transcriptional regulator n=1 Tax=Actinomadura fulvescens TaxID=46160 RepID=A0ABP6CXH1_9ACTN